MCLKWQLVVYYLIVIANVWMEVFQIYDVLHVNYLWFTISCFNLLEMKNRTTFSFSSTNSKIIKEKQQKQHLSYTFSSNQWYCCVQLLWSHRSSSQIISNWAILWIGQRVLLAVSVSMNVCVYVWIEYFSLELILFIKSADSYNNHIWFTISIGVSFVFFTFLCCFKFFVSSVCLYDEICRGREKYQKTTSLSWPAPFRAMNK